MKKNEHDKSLWLERGNRIKMLRISMGDKKQKDFAKKIDFPQGYVSDVENGKQNTSKEMATRIANIYGVTVDYILWGTKDYQQPLSIREESVPYLTLSEDQKKLLDNVKEILDSNDRELIDALKINIKVFLRAIRETNKKK